ncbi:MAG: Ig-like domain-containing protein, partial [Bacteroidota bacterium]
MKKVILACFLVVSTLTMFAQSWNPYVYQAIVSPAPLLPQEFNGTGQLSFLVGNSGSTALPLVTNQEMKLVITLSDGEPNDADPLAALGGTGLGMFNWSYNVPLKTYTAIQNQVISGTFTSTITIQYKVTTNTMLTSAANGFNVNLQPPPYSNGINVTNDDAVSSYTFVQAKDYGDAPLSYGPVSHEINLFKDPTDTYYEYYMYLGNSVDPEPANQSSALANGDDLNGIDDENGVVFPDLIQGRTAVIPVNITIVDGDVSLAAGKLNAWIDWNGDGDFSDAGERISNNYPVDYFTLGASNTGIVNLTVNIPAYATTSPTFARFRFGNATTSATQIPGTNWGEVEDYQITIRTANEPPVTVNENLAVCGNAVLTGNVLSNGDYDPDGPTLTVNTTPVSGPSHGVFSILSNGTYTYTATTGYYGTDQVTVSVCDNGVPSPILCTNDIINITINQPVVADAGSDLDLCSASSTFLVGNNPSPGTGQWTLVSGTNTPTIYPPSGNIAILNGLITSDIPYIYTYTIVNGACTTTDEVKIYNKHIPTVAYAGENQTLCSTIGSATLTGNNPVYGTGTWTQIAGTTTATISAGNPVTVSGLVAGTYTFAWTISNGTCQSYSDLVDVILIPPCDVYAGPDKTICEGSTIRLDDATSSNCGNMHWSTSGDGTFDDI